MTDDPAVGPRYGLQLLLAVLARTPDLRHDPTMIRRFARASVALSRWQR